MNKKKETLSGMDMKKIISRVGSIVLKSPAVDIILGARIDVDSVTITNLEEQAKFTHHLEYVGKPAVIEWRILKDILLNKDTVKLVHHEDSKCVEVISKTGTMKVATMGLALDFPIMARDAKPIGSFTLTEKVVAEIIAASSVCSRDELRLAYTGVNISNKGIAATDAHKLVWYKTVLVDDSVSLIIPAKTCKRLFPSTMTLLDNHNTKFMAATGVVSYNGAIGFLEITTRNIDQRYPDYPNVIPSVDSDVLNVTVGTDVLKKAIKDVMPYANKTSYQIRLNVSGQSLTIHAEDIDRATERLLTLDVKVKWLQENDGKFVIGFNARYLLDVIDNTVSGDTLTLAMSTSSRAGKILDNTDCVRICMPVTINA